MMCLEGRGIGSGVSRNTQARRSGVEPVLREYTPCIVPTHGGTEPPTNTAVLLHTAGRVWEAACGLAGVGRSVTLWGQRVS